MSQQHIYDSDQQSDHSSGSEYHGGKKLRQKPRKQGAKQPIKKEKPIKKETKKKKDPPRNHHDNSNEDPLQLIFDDQILYDNNGIFYSNHQLQSHQSYHSNNQQQKNNHQYVVNGTGQEQNDQSNPEIDSEMRDEDSEIEDIRMKFVEHFNKIKQPHGLVFKRDLRKRLNRQFPQYNFTQQHELDPQGQQIPKINRQISQICIFQKNHHKVNMTSAQFSEYIEQDKQAIAEEFKEASFIFAQEVTSQLYNILRKLCNIGIEFRDRKNPENRKEMIKKFRQFGDKIVSYQDKDNIYFFFGFQFVKFPANNDGINQVEFQNLHSNKEKFKYALRAEYKAKNKYFADFAQKIGLHMYAKIKELNSFRTLN